MDLFQQWNQNRSGGSSQSQPGNIKTILTHPATTTPRQLGKRVTPAESDIGLDKAQNSSQSYMDPFSQSLFQSQSSDYIFSQGLYENETQLEDEEVEIYSNKKKKLKLGGRNGSPKKGTPNKRWAPEFDDYLIPFLVEQVKKGMKVDKTFKKQAFTAAAAAVNAQFNESFSPENVVNHYRVLKTRYLDICKCQNISGAGWDDENKKITLEGPTYNTWAQAHARLKEFVNKPIKHYDELKIICGDDHATGSYRKVIFEQFGGNSNVTIDLEEDEIDKRDKGKSNVEGEQDTSETLADGSSSVVRKPKPSSGKRLKKREDIMEKLIDKVGEVAFAMQNARIAHWSEQLSKCVYSLEGYQFELLDRAFNDLYEDESKARAFIAKPVMAQRMWMDRYKQEMDVEQL